MNIEEKFRDLLLPVFALSSIDEIQAEHSLVNDLGADSLDFVEISYIIESNFGVTLKTNTILLGGTNLNPDDLFVEGVLTAEGANILNQNVPNKNFQEGQTRRQLFNSITVHDLVNIIESRMNKPE